MCLTMHELAPDRLAAHHGVARHFAPVSRVSFEFVPVALRTVRNPA